MLPKHVRYQTALHPVVPVSLACPAGDFLSIHPFQQFVNPQNEFFCGFFDSFWAFFGKSPQMPVFSAFFRFPLPVIRGVFGSYPPAKPSARPCRSAKRRFFTESWGRAAWGRVCGRAKLGAGTLRCLRLCWRLPWDWLEAEQLGRCPEPHKGRCPLTLQGADEKGRSPPLDPFSRLSWSRFHAPFACSFFGASPKPLFAPPNFP